MSFIDARAVGAFTASPVSHQLRFRPRSTARLCFVRGGSDPIFGTFFSMSKQSDEERRVANREKKARRKDPRARMHPPDDADASLFFFAPRRA